MNTDPLILERRYDAPPDRIWNALTDVHELRQWYFPVDDFRPEVGFRFQFPGEGPEGRHYLHHCTVTRVEAGREIAYTWAYEGYSGESELSFVLHPQEAGTRLVLTHAGLHSFPSDNPDLTAGNFVAGWTWFLDKGLRAHLAGEEVKTEPA